MRKKYTYIIGISLLALVAVFASKTGMLNKSQPKAFGAPMDNGSEEDAKGRLEYDLMRLSDPSTGKIPMYMREKELAFAATLPNDEQVNLMESSTVPFFQSRGPWNVGGRTRAFAIDATDENIYVAGSASGGMWRSTDGGSNWTPTTTLTQHQSVTSLAQDTRAGHQNVWYYGSGEAYGQSAGATGAYYIGYGIYKSTDSAKTWTALASTVTSNTTGFDVWSDIIWDMATDPSDTVNDVVYAASYAGIYRSVNGGVSWSLAKGSSPTSSTISYFTDVEVTPTGKVYASLSSDGPVADRGIWRSPDGIAYTNILPGNFPTTYDRLKICYDPSNENVLYVLGTTPGSGQPDTNYLGDVEWNSLWKYTYLSGNGDGSGGQWEDRSANLPTTGGAFDKYQSQGSYDITLRVKPNNPNTLFIGGTNLYRSDNAFADSTQTTFIGGYKIGAALPVVDAYLNHHPDQHEIVFLPSDPNTMISCNDGGIWKTTDNTASTVAWTSLNNGYLTTQFYTCAIDHASVDNVIIGGAQDNGSWFINSSSPTAPWVQPRSGDGSYCAIADNKSAYYFSIQNGKMMRAELDGAGNIDSFARIDPIGGDSDYVFINPFIIDPNNNNIMYLAGGKHLWRNDDLSGIPYASNWDSITTNWVMFPDTLPSAIMKITSLAVSTIPANRLYYGTDKQYLYRIDNANTGTPSRTNITGNVPPNQFPISSCISSIAVDPANADNVMVSFSNYGIYSIFYSSDGGATWLKVAGNLELNSSGAGNGPSVRCVKILPVTGGTVYLAATSTGLYATTALNGLNTIWVQQATGTIGNAVCDMIDYRPTDGLVVVATHGHGIFTSNITDVGDIVSVKNITAIKLNSLGVYPNPMTTGTTIKYTLNKTQHIRIELLNELGETVKELLDTRQEEATHEYFLKRDILKPGMYYVRLSGDKVAVVKLVVQ
jgi:hypothetical protein